MKEEKKHGGSRPGAGRKPKEDSKKQVALKLDRDLYDIFYSSEFSQNRGRYINQAVREKMEREGYLPEGNASGKIG